MTAALQCDQCGTFGDREDVKPSWFVLYDPGKAPSDDLAKLYMAGPEGRRDLCSPMCIIEWVKEQAS